MRHFLSCVVALSLATGCSDTRAHGDAGGRELDAGHALIDSGSLDAGDFDAGPGEFDVDGGRDAGPPPIDAGPVTGCPSGLAAYWRFEESTGPVLDECGDHDGVAMGSGVHRAVGGASGYAIEFDGTDGRVVVPASPALDFLTAGTIELWARIDTTGVGSTVSRGTGNSDDNVLQNTSCWNMQTIYSRAAGGTTNVTSDCDTLPVGAWVHVAVVNDGTNLRMYLNGALSTEAPGGHLGPIAFDLYMGRREQGIFALDGAIDELKWWTISRSQPEICADAGGSWTGASCTLAAP